MGINLQKGQRISLSKEAPGLKKLICGLGWDVVKKRVVVYLVLSPIVQTTILMPP